MKSLRFLCSVLASRTMMGALLGLGLISPGGAQLGPRGQQTPSIENPANREDTDNVSERERQAEAELQTGTALTRRGWFAAAIPHLLAARGQVSNPYAASFNLALCYLGTRQFDRAIVVLSDLRKYGHSNADVENLLAQSFIGGGQPKLAFEALQRAASLTPTNEKLYLFVGDACMDRHDYALGLKVVELGLKNLPDSARLHYQRGLFLSLLDEFDQAKEDFGRARRVPGSETSYLAAAYEQLYGGNPAEAARAAREGLAQGYENPVLLTILGEALIRSGVRFGETEFTEAQIALEKAVAKHPRDPGAQVSLGKLYLMSDRLADAIAHLETARDLEPGNVSVYANLAKAFQRRGDRQQAEGALATLARLNQAQAERISSAPGDRKAGYGQRGLGQQDAAHKD